MWPQPHFPPPAPPAPGAVVKVSEGVLWARIRLDHLNLYLIEDHGGWAAIDAGTQSLVCMEDWEALLRGPLAGTRVTRVTRLIGTHFHPDHIGLAGSARGRARRSGPPPPASRRRAGRSGRPSTSSAYAGHVGTLPRR